MALSRSSSGPQRSRQPRRQSTARSNYSDFQGSVASASVYSDISFDGATSLYTNDHIFESPPPSEYAPITEDALPEDRTTYGYDGPVVICEFVNLLGCNEQFHAAGYEAWKQHMIDHMGGQLPQKSGCPLCSRWTFDAETMGGNEDAAFHRRFQHILHHFRSNRTQTQIGSDRRLVEFMFQNGVLSEDQHMLVSYPGGHFRPQFRVDEVFGDATVMPQNWSFHWEAPEAGEATMVTETSRRRDRRHR